METPTASTSTAQSDDIAVGSTDIRNAIAGMSFEGVTGNFTLDKKGSPKKSVVVLELKDGKPQYKTTIQPAK